jgi:hypothetical protein
MKKMTTVSASHPAGKGPRQHRAILRAIVGVVIAGASGSAHADLIQHLAKGMHMDGATVRVTWLVGSDLITTFGEVEPVGEHAWAEINAPPGTPGFVRFETRQVAPTADTWTDDWVLTNLSQLQIFAVNFNLRTQPGYPGGPLYSIFDATFPSPGTPGSASGRDPTYVSGPLQVFSTLHDLWEGTSDVTNATDLYMQKLIQWGRTPTTPGGFMPGMEYVWKADTDIWVPAPGSIALLGLGAVVAVRRRRREA